MSFSQVGVITALPFKIAAKITEISAYARQTKTDAVIIQKRY